MKKHRLLEAARILREKARYFKSRFTIIGNEQIAMHFNLQADDLEVLAEMESASITSYPIGTTYTKAGRHSVAPVRLCTVVDVLRTYNSKNELVKTRYVTTYQFAGETITNHDVPETTIAMGNPSTTKSEGDK